jgi:hypothetical protein
MAFIRDIAALFENKRISVDIDPDLLPFLKTEDKHTTQRTISFNLYRLVYHTGTIQTRRFAPSNRLKFLDKVDLIEKIHTGTNDFRIKINEIRQVNGPETLISISEDFGIGISVVVAEALFDIKRSTIQKIYGTGRRPDWKCQLNNNRVFVAEAKGASSTVTSQNQEEHALDQKTREPGDIRVASLTVLNENQISRNRFLDPPIENENISPEMQNHILRAGHYASVFSFLGNSRLSRYYSQMRKRLMGIITSEEQTLKNQAFRDLSYNSPIVEFKYQSFVGSFYQIENEKYLFVGVDRRLLSYQGFLSYREFENDEEELIQDNNFILYKDGVLVIEIKEISNFSALVDIERIKNIQDNITISDIDEMNEISFSKFFEYALSKNGFSEFTQQTLGNELQIDLSAIKNKQTYYFEFKLFKKERSLTNTLEQLSAYKRRINTGKLILVTNIKVEETDVHGDIIIVDREKLSQIAKDTLRLSEFIE